mgnify:FL=1
MQAFICFVMPTHILKLKYLDLYHKLIIYYQRPFVYANPL